MTRELIISLYQRSLFMRTDNNELSCWIHYLILLGDIRWKSQSYNYFTKLELIKPQEEEIGRRPVAQKTVVLII